VPQFQRANVRVPQCRSANVRLCFLAVAAALTLTAVLTAQAKPRASELGLSPGNLQAGALNAITDVAGVLVGQTTLIEGDTIRTGVTAILPHGGNLFQEKVPGAVFVGNAFGKLAGSTQVEELGTIETPIVLTNTLAVGTAMDAVVRWTLARKGNENVRSVNAVIGETNDGQLNDIRALPVTREHVLSAIDAAKTGAVEEGSVGAGTGTIAFGWKGGIGTASRKTGSYTVGVLVQTNFGGKLTMGGVPVWKEISPGRFEPTADGSCMIVVATDAPLDARELKRMAARAVFALARTGSTYSNGSGDFAIAFSTFPGNRVTNAAGPQTRTVIPTDGVSGLFEAALDATEEAIYNSLLKATDNGGNARPFPALPIDRLKDVLKKYGR
jgi:D-aminopeptidase